jgi:hypothetical protein
MRVLSWGVTVAALLATGVGGAVAQEEVFPWDVPEVRGWSIVIDTTVGGGCFMSSEFDGGAFATIGFNVSQGNILLVVGDDDWQSIKAGETYDVSLQMGKRPGWEAPALGGRLVNRPTLALTSTDSEFMEEFASQNNIRITYKNAEIMNLSLKGSMAALGEVLRCQEVVNAAVDELIAQEGGGNADPFAN